MYILELNNLGIRKRAISRSITKLERKIHSYIEMHNLSYEPKKIKSYQLIQKALKKNNKIEFETCNTKILIEKLPAL
mgnify:FL=1